MLRLDTVGRVTGSDTRVWAPARVMVDAAGRAGVWCGDHRVPVWSGLVVEVVPNAPPGVPHNAGPWSLRASDGTVLTVVREGCGCGSRLSVLGEVDLAGLGLPAAVA